MRRRILLVLLWLAGTAVATGVVFQAVVVMTNTFRNAGEGTGQITGGSPKPSQGTTTAGSVPAIGSATVVTTEPAATTVAGTDAEVETSTATSTGGEPPGPSATGSATSTGTRTTIGPATPTTAERSTSATPPPTRATVPTLPPTEPPTAPPTPAPTTAATPPPTTASTCALSEIKAFAAGPNRFSVRVCSETESVRYLSAKVGVGYNAVINQFGPPIVEITFTGSTTYHCVVELQGGVIPPPCTS